MHMQYSSIQDTKPELIMEVKIHNRQIFGTNAECEPVLNALSLSMSRLNDTYVLMYIDGWRLVSGTQTRLD